MNVEPASTYCREDRILFRSVLAIAGLTVGLHVIGAIGLEDSLWGAHLYAFCHPAVLIVATAALLGICAALVLREEAIGEHLPPLPLDQALARRPLLLGFFALMGAAVMWMVRSRSTYLGDGTVLMNSVADGQTFHPREPLTMIGQAAMYKAAGPFFASGTRGAETVAHDAIALGSVLAGLVFMVLAWVLARELVRLRGPGPDGAGYPHSVVLLVTLILISQGYIQLFFGYVENYAFYTVSVALYLWLSLRFLRGDGPLLLPALALLAAVAFHIASVILLPSFAALCIWAFIRPGKRIGALRDLLVTGALVLGVQFAFSTWQTDYSLFATLFEASGFAVTRQAEHVPMFSVTHVRDFVNEQILIGPLGLLLFVAAAVTALAVRKLRGAAEVFLVVTGLCYLGAAWLAGDSNLGYARDWDIWAPGGLVFTAAGLGLFLAIAKLSSPRGAVPALVAALVLSLYHTVPWIAVNASPERGLARLKTLPLGLGRTEVLVSQWYRSEGYDDERRLWLHKAVAVNPANNNAHYLLGIYFSEKGDMKSAADSFRRAVKLRPDKVLFRQRLVDALLDVGRDEEALRHLEFEVAHQPENPARWRLYGETLRGAGRHTDAAAVFEKTLLMYQGLLQQDPESFESNLTCGWLLYNLARYDEALTHFETALALRPDSDSVLCLIGYSLSNLARADESTEYFKRCLRINPDRPDRADIERRLSDAKKTPPKP
jgi:tetratricopeptide (TPR) repeat protein